MKKMETRKSSKRKRKPSKKSTTSTTSKKCLMSAISDDLRKIGIFLLGAGQLGVLMNDKVTGYEGLLVMVVGVLFWIIGLYYSHVSSEISDINEG